MENTRTLLFSSCRSVLVRVKQEEGRERERERERRGGQATINTKKFSNEKNERNKLVWKCVSIEFMYKKKTAHIERTQ